MTLRSAALAASCALFFGQAAFAVGSDSSEPPQTAPTTTVCADGQIWDEKKKACVPSDSSSLDDDMRYRAVRELAYAGRYDSALMVLGTMQPHSDRAQTYRGFIARKEGDWPKALEFYQQALAVNLDNILARSYLGQGFAIRGEYREAELQLAEIRARDGAGTWAEAALVTAIAGDEVADY